jgi:hypothetical protein
MAHKIVGGEESVVIARERVAMRASPARSAYSLLYFAYIVAPIAAGLDKFFHYLVDWNIYLSPAYARVAGGNVTGLMHAVGVVEICAGLLVAAKPRLGGVIVAFWMWGIILNLLLIPGYYDVALRDFGLSLGALALSRLAVEFGR